MADREALEKAYVLLCQAEEQEDTIRQIRWQRREARRRDAMYEENRKALKAQKEAAMLKKGMYIGGAVSVAVLAAMFTVAAIHGNPGGMSSMYLAMATLVVAVMGPFTGRQMMQRRVEKLQEKEKADAKREAAFREEELRQMQEKVKDVRAQAAALLPEDAPKVSSKMLRQYIQNLSPQEEA